MQLGTRINDVSLVFVFSAYNYIALYNVDSCWIYKLRFVWYKLKEGVGRRLVSWMWKLSLGCFCRRQQKNVL